jgi:uncharacterized membrane protein YfcA
MPDMDAFLLVFGAGLLAGAMNALAGGGSFVSLPALIAVGIPSVQASASGAVALFSGGAASAWAYRDGLGPIGPVSVRAIFLATVIGGAAGAILLLLTPTKVFDVALPWLLLLALLALGFGRQLGEWLRRRYRISAAAVLAIQVVLGAYGGYFGGAVGLMMMAVWGLLESRDIKSLSAPRTLMVVAARTIAILIFIGAGAIHWPETLVMLFAAVIGGYLGALLGRRAPAGLIRGGTLLLTAGITVAFFVRAYGG